MTLLAHQQIRISNVVTRFDEIYRTAMQDVPIVNTALGVEAVDFRPWSTEQWEHALLGVLITPWFINLLILPEQCQAQTKVKTGDPTDIGLPAGFVECLWAHDNIVGSYLSCSLMSPVHDIPDQNAGTELARQTLCALLSFPSTHNRTSTAQNRRGFLKRFAYSDESGPSAGLETKV